MPTPTARPVYPADATGPPGLLVGVLGDGRAVGYVGWTGRQNYADRPQLCAQLEVTLADGSTTTVVSDGSWA